MFEIALAFIVTLALQSSGAMLQATAAEVEGPRSSVHGIGREKRVSRGSEARPGARCHESAERNRRGEGGSPRRIIASAVMPSAGRGCIATYDARGLELSAVAAGWSWRLELERYGWSDVRTVGESPRATFPNGRKVAYEWDENLTEWFVELDGGIEHGYDVRARPVQARGGLSIVLRVSGDLAAKSGADRRSIAFVDAAGATVVAYDGLDVVDAVGRHLRAEMTAEDGRIFVQIADEQAAFPITVDPFVHVAYLKASNTGAGDAFGLAVAEDGDTLVIGAPLEDSAATGVGGNQADNSAADAGAAYVYVRVAGVWQQQAYLKASNSGAGDRFGIAVAISGDTLVVGADFEDSAANGVGGDGADDSKPNSGAAYVFVRSGSVWSQQAYVKASNTDSGDWFGRYVAIHGDTVVIGAQSEDSSATAVNGDQASNGAADSGAAYVFVRSGTSWSQEAYLKASNAEAVDRFGCAVGVSGSTIVVGASDEDSSAAVVDGDQSNNSANEAGAAYVFVRSGTTWSQQAYLKASNTDPVDTFGGFVAISGDTVVVGANREDSSATGVNGDPSDDNAADAGAAYVFVRTAGAWSQQAYVKPSSASAGSWFGAAVAVLGDRIVVGARFQAALGPDSGAAYVFDRNGSTWAQHAYLQAPNAAIGDNFGAAVSLSGGSIVVGALFEDSAAVGVNGDLGDESSTDAGAAYVFEDTVAVARFCLGDGSGSNCPCGNNGAPGNGCANSGFAAGADLTAFGTASVGADSIVLGATNLTGPVAIFFQGSTRTTQVAIDDGLGCVGAPIIRLGTRFTSGSAASYPGVGDPSVSVRGAIPAYGGTYYYQCYYRNAAALFCPPATSNRTNGVQVTWGV